MFEVLGTNNSGVSGRAAATQAFTIAPYFYESAWFYLLLAMALGVLVLLSNRWVLRRHHNRRVALERLVQQRTRDLQQANRQLEAISLTDPLTSLHNRRYLARQLPADIAYYQRMPKFATGVDVLAFVLLDIDHFKSINDGHGHQAGDHVLQTVAHRLRILSREGDYVVRWGGEEFLMVFRPMPRARAARPRPPHLYRHRQRAGGGGRHTSAGDGVGRSDRLSAHSRSPRSAGVGATGLAGGPRAVRGQGARAERLGGLRSLAVALAVARCRPCATRSRRARPQCHLVLRGPHHPAAAAPSPPD